MNNILHLIIEKSKTDLERKKIQTPQSVLKERIRNMEPRPEFTVPFKKEGIHILAELKKASPSKGVIRKDFPVLELALELEKNGAAALSVLTEKNYFLGSEEYLEKLAGKVGIPLLRKDFIYDPYQIYEAKALGASAVLLIAAMLDDLPFKELTHLAHDLGLAVLGEAHNEKELQTILTSQADLCGINARNLNTFETSLEQSVHLLQQVPQERLPIAESAIQTREDIETLRKAGAVGFLIGETLMRAEHPGRKLKELCYEV